MEHELNILKIFNDGGFTKILEEFEDFLNKKELFINFIILNIKKHENVKLLCNFIKLDVIKYKFLINKIVASDISYRIKRKFILNIFNNSNVNNINILTNDIYNLICMDTFVYDDTNENEIIFDSLLYKIFDTPDIEKKDINLEFYFVLFENIINVYNKEVDLLKWIFKICNYFNYRCKSYVNKNYNDNILYVLSHSLFNYVNKYKTLDFSDNIIIDIINNNIDIINIDFNDETLKTNDSIYFVLIHKIINVTVFYNIEDLKYYKSKLNNYIEIGDYLNNNVNILDNIKIIKEYIIKKNKIKQTKHEELINNLHIKLNYELLENINIYYINILKCIQNNKENFKENNECFSNIIINIIDVYLYDNYKHIYKDLKEKYDFHTGLLNIFMGDNSNVNINIKYINLLKRIICNDDIIKNINNNNELILIEKILSFYINLDTYEDELSKLEIKGKIINICLLYFTYVNNKIITNVNKDILFKFILRINEDISININDLLYYIINKNLKIKLDILFKLDELLRLNIYIFNNILNVLNNKIVHSVIDKYNENICLINDFIDMHFIKKNNDKLNINEIHYLNEILLNKMIFYNILYNSDKYILYIKNESLYFDNDLFKNISLNIKNNTSKQKDISIIELYILLLEKIENMKDIEENKTYENIPDEFLDPIYNTLIENPIILPSSKKIMDYDIIKQHLFYGNFDPFNRDKLTIDMIDDYNNIEENRKKIEELKEKIKLWKENN